jgi:hypothetical protein
MSLFNIVTGGQKVLFKIPNKAVLEIDATPSITHERVATVTKFPVEDGTNISDHMTLNNKTVSLECVITNQPSSFLRSVFSAAISSHVRAKLDNVITNVTVPSIITLATSPNERVANSFKILNSLWENRIPFTVIAGLDVYDDIVITNLRFSESTKTKGALKFSITLEQIQVATTFTVQLQNVNLDETIKHTASEKTDIGTQVSDEVSTAVNKKASSILLKMTNAIGGAL